MIIEEKKPRLFILGSCVSRDMLDSVPDQFELVSYLARTSMASIGMPPVDDREAREAVGRLASPFQQRMLFNDLDKTTLQKITETEHDILLVDFVDERFKLVLVDVTCFSLSSELEKSGFSPGDRVALEPDSEAFLDLWMAGMRRLIAAVGTKKLVLNKAFWAERLPDGQEAPYIGWVRRNNALLLRLYECVERHWHLRSIDYPPELLVSDPHHRWGSAPYHFGEAFYQYGVTQLKRMFPEAQ